MLKDIITKLRTALPDAYIEGFYSDLSVNIFEMQNSEYRDLETAQQKGIRIIIQKEDNRQEYASDLQNIDQLLSQISNDWQADLTKPADQEIQIEEEEYSEDDFILNKETISQILKF